MRHQTSRSPVDVLRRVPPATARLLGEATQNGRPGRALVALLVVMALGAGGYAVGRAITDPPSDHEATSAGPTASYDGGEPASIPGTPTSGEPTPDGRSDKPGAP